MKQHQLFCREEEQNARVLRHMRRSGHFEFGLDRRVINTGDPRVELVVSLWDEGREVEGWAHYWAMIYDHVADVLESDAAIREAAMVLRYEDLCENPSTVFSRILVHCDLPPEELPKLAAQRIKHPSYYRPSFTQEEEAMIRRITAPSAQRFGYAAQLRDVL